MTAQPATKRSHPHTPIGVLLNKYDISLAQLRACMEKEGVRFTSRSTLHRMVHRRISPGLREQLHPKAAVCIGSFLASRGISKTEIDNELTAVFTEGEYQPMIRQRIALNAEECRYFGFPMIGGKYRDPFAEPPSTREEVFLSPPVREIFDAAMDAIRYRHFVAIIGPIGSGKTTLRALIEDQTASDPDVKVIWPEFFDQQNVTPIEIARTILRETDTPAPARTTSLGAAVKDKLQSMTQNGKRVALAFDECHRMHKDAIRSLKNFFEMSSGGFQKYLGVVLFGWPSFISMLEMPAFQEIYERIHVLEMPQFSDHAEGYLRHRLKLVGARLEDLFDKDAVDLITSQSETPLGLGNIANESLRIMKREFDGKKVIGAAIRTKMYFEAPREPGFKKR